MKNKLLKQLKVLLVEDEVKLAKLLKNTIGDNFYSFTIANNGKEGMDKFLSLRPDIVITDIMMPEVTGLEMAQEIKKIDKTIPIIILSAFSDTTKLLNAIDIGVIKYFIKPFDIDELLEYIESISEDFDTKVIQLNNGYAYNKTTNNLYKDGRYISLSKKEKLLIELLLKYHEENKEVVEDIKIKTTLWSDENVSDERLRTFVKRLRAKTSKELILNIKGQGYTISVAQ